METQPKIITPLYIPISGTFARKNEHHGHGYPWYRRNSAFDRSMVAMGYQRIDQDGDPDRVDAGFWTGDLEGSLLTGDWPWNPTHDVWEDAADKLHDWIVERWPRLEGKLTVIAHSHGGQIAAYASRRLARKGLMFEHLVTVDTPLRRDMDNIWLGAIGGFKRWTHLHSGWGWGSRMRWLGARALPWKRMTSDLATINIPIPDHSSVLRNPYFRDPKKLVSFQDTWYRALRPSRAI